MAERFKKEVEGTLMLFDVNAFNKLCTRHKLSSTICAPNVSLLPGHNTDVTFRKNSIFSFSENNQETFFVVAEPKLRERFNAQGGETKFLLNDFL